MTYEWKKTFNKFFWIAFEVGIAGTVVYLTDNNLFIVLIPILEALRNYLKHR